MEALILFVAKLEQKFHDKFYVVETKRWYFVHQTTPEKVYAVIDRQNLNVCVPHGREKIAVTNLTCAYDDLLRPEGLLIKHK